MSSDRTRRALIEQASAAVPDARLNRALRSVHTVIADGDQDTAREMLESLIRKGKRHFDRARRARIGSNERRKHEDEASECIARAFSLADAAGVDPKDLPEWSYDLLYGPG